MRLKCILKRSLTAWLYNSVVLESSEILNVVGVILRVPGNKIFQENSLKQQHPD